MVCVQESRCLPDIALEYFSILEISVLHTNLSLRRNNAIMQYMFLQVPDKGEGTGGPSLSPFLILTFLEFS